MFILLIESYFAFMLMVSGFAKLDDLPAFRAALRAAKILPTQSLGFAGWLIPSFEIILAILLVSGLLPTIAAAVNLLLFVGFHLFKVHLYYQKSPIKDCGCLGSYRQQELNADSITVSSILVILAVLYLWLVCSTPAAAIAPRTIVLIAFLTLGSMIFLRLIQRRIIVRAYS